MTHTDYTRNILNIKDENIIFDENCLEEIKINNIDTKVFHGKLTYTLTYCEICGAKNNGYNDIIKWNWKYNCTIKLPKISNFNTILVLDKQRFYCKHCDKTFIARTNVMGYRKQISNNTELSIKLELMNKISEKDISKRFNVSHNKVNRIMHELSNKKKKYSNHFKKEMTEYEIVQYLINTNIILKETYNLYQSIIKSIRNKDINLFIKIIESTHQNISEYMETTLKTYKSLNHLLLIH